MLRVVWRGKVARGKGERNEGNHGTSDSAGVTNGPSSDPYHPPNPTPADTKSFITSTPGRTPFIHLAFALANFEVYQACFSEQPHRCGPVAADDGGLAPSFSPDPLLQYSSNIRVRIRAAGLLPSHPRPEHFALVVSRYVSSFVLAVGAVLM
jgi:hypothetical protein